MFSQKLKQLRENDDISQIRFAKEIGYSQASIAAWENGTREPGINTLIKIAQFFNVSIDYLVGKVQQEQKKEKNTELTSSEQTLLANYKRLPEDLRRLAETYVKKLVSLHETSIPTRIAPVPKTEPQQIPKKKTGISPA